MNKKITVLSLFDGISCGQVALKQLGYDPTYYSSEIDKYAIKIAMKNHPNTIQLGDVKNWREWKLPKIDMILAGFPCQSWSVAGKGKGIEDPRGKLVLDLIDIWKHYKPKYFLFENVRMKKEYLNYIDNLFGVEHIRIDSNLVSAQNRKRCYWTNIPNIEQPEDRGIMLKDIVHENVDLDYSAIAKNKKAHALTASYNGAIPSNSFERKQRTMLFEELEKYIVPFDKTLKILEKEVEKGKVGFFRKDSQANRVYYIHDKAITLCGEAGGGAAKMGQYLFGCITPDRINKRQNGQRFSTGKKFYTLTAQDQHGVLIEGYIRKLTPIECERLQTMEDGYTEGVSNSQRYKALGNGWTVDVITHIFKNIKL